MAHVWTQPAEVARVGAVQSKPVEKVEHTVPAWQPLTRVTPGEWVEYESQEKLRTRYEVLKVASGEVTTRVTVHQVGRNWGEPAIRENGVQYDFLEESAKRRDAERTCRSAVTEAAGQRWECLLYEDRWTDEDVPYVRRTWVSQHVPYLGTVRMELYGGDQLEAQLVLVAWGKPAGN